MPDNKIDKLRADMNAGFAETRAGFAQMNQRMDFLYRALIVLIVFVAGGCVGIAAAAVKFIFGV